MLTDLKIEFAKEEYVNAINEINKKYNLPFTIVEIILNGILIEVSNLKNNKITQEREKLNKEKESDKNGKD